MKILVTGAHGQLGSTIAADYAGRADVVRSRAVRSR
jgi:dTDP-4-dehydrorhamnose reductase